MPSAPPSSQHDLTRAFARTVARGTRGFRLTASNVGDGWAEIDELVAEGAAFAVPPRPDLLAVDCDVADLGRHDAAERLAAFWQLVGAVRSVGAAAVVVSSGTAGNLHCFAGVGSGPGRAGVETWCRERHLDVRARGIRPPMVPHRSGGRSVIVDDDPASALERLGVPGRGAAQVASALGVGLSARMQRVLRDGHEAGGYRSPSHGRMAVAVAGAGRGLGPGWLAAVLRDPRNTLGETFRGRPARWQDAEVVRLHMKAQAWLETHPSPRAEDATAASWAATVAAQPWTGMAGGTDIAVAEALGREAARCGTSSVGVALAKLGALAGVSRDTARRSLRRLEQAGWVRLVAAATPTTTAVWRLVIPTGVARQAPPVWRPEAADLGADVARWACLGKSAARVWRELSATPVSSALVGRRLGSSTRAVWLHLRRLAEAGLAVRTADGWVVGAADPQEVAFAAGTAGRRDADLAAYAAERARRAELRTSWRAARKRAAAAWADGDYETFSSCAAVLPERVLAAVSHRSGAAPPHLAAA